MTIVWTSVLLACWMTLLSVGGTMGDPILPRSPLSPTASQHHLLDAQINKMLTLPTDELTRLDWKQLVLDDGAQQSNDDLRSYVEHKAIERAHLDRLRSQKKKKQLTGWTKSMKQHMHHRQRLLQQEAQQQLHDTCATAKLVQPDGPGTSVVLSEESNENLATIDRPLFCGQYELDYPMLYYKFQGTGNPFYITTCNKNHNSEKEYLTPILNVATVADCNDVSTMACIQEEHSSFFKCPDSQDGASYTFATENQTEYLFSVRGFFGSAGNFSITVGEIDTLAAQNNSQCATSTEIALPTGDSPTTTVRGNTQGAWSPNSPRDGVCSTYGGPYGNPTSGLWYAMDSPGTAKVTLSTCTSSSSPLNNTTIHPYIAVMAETKTSVSTCTNETLQCLEAWEGDTMAYGGVNFVSRPDERYRIYVAGLYETEYGDIEFKVTVEEAEPFGLCRDEWERRESKQGVDCACEQSLGSGVELTCQDSCLHCSSSTGFCYNRTDTISFGSDLNATFKGYSIDVDYDGLRSNTPIVYEALNDGACSFFINGSSCFSCQTQECGAPLVNCTGDELWDFCGMDDDVVFRAAPVPRQPCGSYVSDTICERNAQKIVQSESLNCTCATNAENSNYLSTKMACRTDCGFFCNMEKSNCGKIDLTHIYELDGTQQSRERWFQPVEEEEDSVQFYQAQYSCLLDNCECELKTCEDNSIHAFANCTAVEGGGIFDFCNDTMEISSGPYEFLSRPFGDCIDLTPINAKCESAIDLVVNTSDLIVGSTVFVTDDSRDTCNEFSGNGLYYRVIGTGERLRVSTCSEDTNFSTELSIHSGCKRCIENAQEAFCENGLMGESIDWDSEDGQDYTVYVGGFFGDRGTFALQLTNVSALNYESCESQLDSLGSDSCECLVDADFPEVSYLDCTENCTRCNPANDLCGTVITSDMMENGVVFGGGFTFTFTKGSEASVAMFSAGQECFVSIRDAADEFDCLCHIVSCSDGNMTYAVDCSEFQEGLSINFCDAMDCSAQPSAETTTKSDTPCYKDAGILAPLAPHDNFLCEPGTSDLSPTFPPSPGGEIGENLNVTTPSLTPEVRENATSLANQSPTTLPSAAPAQVTSLPSDLTPTFRPSPGGAIGENLNVTTPSLTPEVRENATSPANQSPTTLPSVAPAQVTSLPSIPAVTSAPFGVPLEFTIPQGGSSAGNINFWSFGFTLMAFIVVNIRW